MEISIHSTTRVETNTLTRYSAGTVNFNPLHHEGGDWRAWRLSQTPWYFNPLHHEGGDLTAVSNTPQGQLISIHSTTRVETMFKQVTEMRYHISIHSTTRVETRFLILIIPYLIFQSTPPRGWRPSSVQYLLFSDWFQSTPPRGWRRKPASKNTFFISRFQSTPPRGWRQ